MAETLGTMIDKLTIKQLREYHLNEMLKTKNKKFPVSYIKKMIKLVRSQKESLAREIEWFVAQAIKGKVIVRDEKLKLYNSPADMNRIPGCFDIGEAISLLGQKNAELWRLEDEARRKDAGLAYIGRIKAKIDFANQQRNDLIDKIDEILDAKIKNSSGKRIK
jgi:hypothetical protein